MPTMKAALPFTMHQKMVALMLSFLVLKGVPVPEYMQAFGFAP